MRWFKALFRYRHRHDMEMKFVEGLGLTVYYECSCGLRTYSSKVALELQGTKTKRFSFSRL